MIYTADYIVTLDGPPIADGAIRVEGNNITDVGEGQRLRPESGEKVRELGETVILPGLINAHCHLELSHARNLFPRGESFSMWVSRLQKSLGELEPENFNENIRLGVWECIRTGTTTVCDIGNTGYNFEILKREPIRSYPVLEGLGLNPVDDLIQFQNRWNKIVDKIVSTSLSSRCKPSAGAHSPYSCSPKLLEAINEQSRGQEFPFTLHLAEGEEEQELFEKRSGRLYDFCKRKYPKVPHYRGLDSVQYLHKKNLLPPGALAVHCNTLDQEAAQILASANASIVHCPRSRDFFGHPTFPFEMCYNLGINICLGTDGLASNENYNLFEEMAEFRRVYPQVDCESILKMTTVQAAKAIRREDDLGRIKTGYLADFIGLRMKHHPAWDIFDEIVCEEHDVGFSLIDGEEVIV